MKKCEILKDIAEVCKSVDETTYTVNGNGWKITIDDECVGVVINGNSCYARLADITSIGTQEDTLRRKWLYIDMDDTTFCELRM